MRPPSVQWRGRGCFSLRVARAVRGVLVLDADGTRALNSNEVLPEDFQLVIRKRPASLAIPHNLP